MVEMWSCKGCSYHKSEQGCTKKNGCYFIPAIIRLEKLLNPWPNELNEPTSNQQSKPKTY
ncbi:MAG: hypothetical protein QW231_01610 [Candidatus Bathyarchaeia archaeon]